MVDSDFSTESLRSLNRNKTLFLASMTCSLLLVSLFLFIQFSNLFISKDYSTLSNSVTSSFSLKFVENNHFEWMDKRGTVGERTFYYYLLDSFLSSSPRILSQFNNFERTVFFVSASSRIILIFIIFGILWAYKKNGGYKGFDILGLSGNGRAFYSGVKIKLGKNGDVPDMHIPGLACVAKLPIGVIKNFPITKELTSYKAINATNLELIATIAKHKDYPVYLKEEGLISVNQNILEHSRQFLVSLLKYQHQLHISFQSMGEVENSNTDKEVAISLLEKQSLSKNEFYQLLILLVKLSLSTKEKKALSDLSPAIITSAILGNEAGKVMAYKNRNGAWTKESNFPHYCARAVVQSLDNYSRDYNYNEREAVRRSIIYSVRNSDWGKVKFPEILSVDIQALRKILEILQGNKTYLLKLINNG